MRQKQFRPQLGSRSLPAADQLSAPNPPQTATPDSAAKPQPHPCAESRPLRPKTKPQSKAAQQFAPHPPRRQVSLSSNPRHPPPHSAIAQSATSAARAPSSKAQAPDESAAPACTQAHHGSAA